MKIKASDRKYMLDRCRDIMAFLNTKPMTDDQKLVAINLNALRLAMHVQDVIKRQKP